MRATPPSLADVGRHALERHHRDRAGVLGDLGLLGGRDVHDHAALEHLGEAGLERERPGLLVVHRRVESPECPGNCTRTISRVPGSKPNLELASLGVNRYIVTMTMWSPRLEGRTRAAVPWPSSRRWPTTCAQRLAAGRQPAADAPRAGRDARRDGRHREPRLRRGRAARAASRARSGRGTFVRGQRAARPSATTSPIDLGQNHPPDPLVQPQRARARSRARRARRPRRRRRACSTIRPRAAPRPTARPARRGSRARVWTHAPEDVLVCTGSQHGLTVAARDAARAGQTCCSRSR